VPTSRLVPDDFAVPAGLLTEVFALEPLGVRHNDSDHAAWMSSIEHIRRTPRAGFTYTVLDPATGDVMGCVYLYPSKRPGSDADVRSWVRADRAELDKPLYELVSHWLADSWPFRGPDYAPR
jgi:hypothetical protein